MQIKFDNIIILSIMCMLVLQSHFSSFFHSFLLRDCDFPVKWLLFICVSLDDVFFLFSSCCLHLHLISYVSNNLTFSNNWNVFTYAPCIQNRSNKKFLILLPAFTSAKTNPCRARDSGKRLKF